MYQGFAPTRLGIRVSIRDKGIRDKGVTLRDQGMRV
jgi:hypothetical protein